MTKKVYVIILSFLLIGILTSCKTTKFNGNRTSNDKQFLIDYTIFNSTDSAELKLNAGDIVAVDVVSESGKVNIEIKKEGQDPIYTGKAVPTMSFTVTIGEDGIYTAKVTGIKAKGSVSIIKK